MAKTEKELNELREKVEALSEELKELTEEELEKVAGGNPRRPRIFDPEMTGNDILGNNPYGAVR